MVRVLVFLFSTASAGLIVFSAHAELLLSPTIEEYELDGARFTRLAFSDGSEKVTYRPPHGWDYSGSPTRLTLRPPDKAQAEALIIRVPLPEPADFGEESLKKLVAEAVAALPKGSLGVTVVSQEKNPIKINHKETFQVTLRYTVFGYHFNRSILFLNRNKEQIRSQLTCLEADFPELQRAFFASQYGWQGL